LKRRRAREYALQILFQIELSGEPLSAKVFQSFWKGLDEGKDVKNYTRQIVENTWKSMGDIDRIIREAAENWSVDRMAAIDRNILRAATYEMVYRTDIPAQVAINEAIEISRKFSTVESAPFINGILDRIARLNVHQNRESNK